MREQLVYAEETREALFASIAPWLDALAPQIPAEASQLRALLALQLHPTMARLVLIGEKTGTVREVARAAEGDLPGGVEIAAAAEQFIAAGLSAVPETVAAAAFEQAAKHGAGFVILLDPLTGSARALLAPRAVGAERWIEMFSIAPEGVEVSH